MISDWRFILIPFSWGKNEDSEREVSCLRSQQSGVAGPYSFHFKSIVNSTSM